MNSTKESGYSFGMLAIEVISIVFGVFLALAANEWRQQYNDQKKAEIAFEGIKNEMNSNKEFIEKRLPYYRAMRDTIKIILSQKGRDVGFNEVEIPGFHGINPPLLRDSALQTAISTQAFANFDFRLANKISLVYSFQENYIKWVDNYMNAFIGSESPKLRKVYSLFSEIAQVGEELAETYGQMAAINQFPR
ncbi:MAG: hypothetical protein H6696_18330 [Deferribacteres bacterium]|nr:hypothetical protein [candidate division KSB1 bacterium]MCB9503885.1 hypothetical protein [Deferribacteres bacterium]